MLPRNILLKRLNNELAACSGYLGGDFRIPDDVRFPIEIRMTMYNVPGYASRNERIDRHEILIVITEDYGFKKPEVRWLTPIFHPNIMMPEDGGYVCIKLLNDWEFGNTLLSFIKCIESLVREPNPRSPFGTASCLDAAEFFVDDTSRFSATIVSGGEGCRR